MKINTFRYTPETVDCRLCTEYISKKRGCRQQICPWIAERIEAGVVGYSEAVFGNAPHDKELLLRLCNLIQSFPGSLWRDGAHSLRMEQMLAALGYYPKRNTPEWYAAVYLLSSDEDLCRRTINCFGRKDIFFRNARMRGISILNYDLLMASRCIYCHDDKIELADMVNPEIIDDEAFRLIVNAQLIALYGLPVLNITERTGVR